ncbi:MAG: hypothetical protein BWY88_00335 [Synergistetes bacterium ADurb.Bin520]|nr:MAG: hypothetical protein BWY88_00335 [Synergistetes bacterium ADurb.Bin520]
MPKRAISPVTASEETLMRSLNAQESRGPTRKSPSSFTRKLNPSPIVRRSFTNAARAFRFTSAPATPTNPPRASRTGVTTLSTGALMPRSI